MVKSIHATRPAYVELHKLEERYGLDPMAMTGESFLVALAQKFYRGNLYSAADRLIGDFRKGNLGPITLEGPPPIDDLDRQIARAWERRKEDEAARKAREEEEAALAEEEGEEDEEEGEELEHSSFEGDEGEEEEHDGEGDAESESPESQTFITTPAVDLLRVGVGEFEGW
jgi:hypothetical protein